MGFVAGIHLVPVSIDTMRTRGAREHDRNGGGGGNRTRVRKPSASRAYMRIRFVQFRERRDRTGKVDAPLAL